MFTELMGQHQEQLANQANLSEQTERHSRSQGEELPASFQRYQWGTRQPWRIDRLASTASAHFSRLREQGLVEMHMQGRHRYYGLANTDVARALEALLLLTGRQPVAFKPSTPSALKLARTCYHHCAGEVSVKLHNELLFQGWIQLNGKDYSLSEHGKVKLTELGIDLNAVLRQRRRLAYPCMDWSERSPHLGGALGAALLAFMVGQGWMTRHLDSRAFAMTKKDAAKLNKIFRIAS